MTVPRALAAALCANLAYPTAETSHTENRHGRKKIVSWRFTGKKKQFTFWRTQIQRA
jgi:hypothetical protein